MTDMMTPSVNLVVTAAVLFGCGVYLLLARSVIRALIGFLLLSNGINLLFIVASGNPGDPPVLGDERHHEVYTDPVPQALVLTAIVITLGLTAFVLALAHRAWQLTRSDLVDDDPESARIHHLAETNDPTDGTADAEDDATLAAGADEDNARGAPARAERAEVPERWLKDGERADHGDIHDGDIHDSDGPQGDTHHGDGRHGDEKHDGGERR